VIYASIYNAQSFEPFTQPGIRKSSRFYSTELTGFFLWVFVFIVSLSLLLGKPFPCNKFSTDLIKGFALYLQKLQPYMLARVVLRFREY